MIANILFGGVVALLLHASYLDVTSLRIPNWTVIAIAGCFVPFALAIQMPASEFLLHIGAGVMVLAVGFGLFFIGLRFGGGDAKLCAALSLWCGLRNLVPFFVMMCFVGGAVALIVLALRRFGIPVWLAARGWNIPALNIEKSKAVVPYAPAMALAFVFAGLSALPN